MIKKFIKHIMIGALVSTGGMCAFLVLLFIGGMVEKLLSRTNIIDIIGISLIILILSALVAAILAVIGYSTFNGLSDKEKEKWKW